MPIFALERLQAVVGKLPFFQLLINGKSQFEGFEHEVRINPQYYSEYKTLLTYMNLVALLERVPAGKMKDITPEREEVKEYEFKSDHLRIYAFHLERTGKIIVYGGYKNSQKADIRQFRSMKKMFLNSLRK